MRYILILLLTILPALASAAEKHTESACICKEPKGSYYKYEKWRCLWGDKLEQVYYQAENVGELLRAAMVDDEYAQLEKHLEFPVEIQVIDFKEKERRIVSDAMKYHFIANNLQEFQEAFEAIMALDTSRDLLRSFQYESMRCWFYRDKVAIDNSSVVVQAKVQCADFKPAPKHPELVLPRDRKFCSKTSIAIKSMQIRLN